MTQSHESGGTPKMTAEPALAMLTSPDKILSLGVLALEGEGEPLAASGIVQEINARQEENSPGKLQPGAHSTIARHGESLKRAGLVEIDTSNNTPTYAATREGVRFGLALVGVATSWQANNPSIPLQKVFGAHTRSTTPGTKDTAEVRFNLVEAVIQNPQANLKGLAQTLGETPKRLYKAAENLVADGVLQTVSAPRGATMNINPTALLEYSQKGRASSPTTLAIKGAADNLAAQNKFKVTKGEFLDAVRQHDPQQDPEQVWQNVLDQSANKQLRFIDLHPAVQKMVLNPEYEPVRELVDSVQEVVKGNPDLLEKARRIGQNILSDKELVGKLSASGGAAKQPSSSSSSSAQTTQTSQSSGGTVTADTKIEEVKGQWAKA